MAERIKISNNWTIGERRRLTTLIEKRIKELSEKNLNRTEKNLAGAMSQGAIEVMSKRIRDKRARLSVFLKKLEIQKAGALERARKESKDLFEFILPEEKKRKKINHRRKR